MSELTIDDLLHEGSHFPRLVSVRDDTASHRSSLAAANEHFLSVGLELSPPPVHIHEKPVDTRVSMAMKGLDIIVSKSLIKRLSKFFSAPFKETEELDQVAIDQVLEWPSCKSLAWRQCRAFIHLMGLGVVARELS